MSDIIRLARMLYGPAYDQMTAEAGKIKQEYVAGGGDPSHVYSPERVEMLKRMGPHAVEQSQNLTRPDGSIAGPYVPTPLALATNMIEKRAIPAVMDAHSHGITTVSSGVDNATGRGFAIGRAPDGSVTKVIR